MDPGSWESETFASSISFPLHFSCCTLYNPPPKIQFKSMVKSHVVNYWETKLRVEAAQLKSLVHFQPNYMSLVRPHPIWTTCGSNSFEVNKAVTQARMLSGRYCTDQLSRHWSRNREGICLLPGCSGLAIGSLEHILLQCPALHSTRVKLVRLCQDIADNYPNVRQTILSTLFSNDNLEQMQFLLDCSTMPQVIVLRQTHGFGPLHQLFYVSRNWCYSIHRKRMDILGLYQFRWHIFFSNDIQSAVNHEWLYVDLI